MSLPLRTAKYALAVLAAALTAQALGLLNPMTAGVIALLSLSDTDYAQIGPGASSVHGAGLGSGLVALC